MMITDPYVHGLLHPSKVVEYAVMAVFAAGVIIVGRLIVLSQRRKAAFDEPDPEPVPVPVKE